MATASDIVALQALFSQLQALTTDAITLGKSGVSLESFSEIMKVYSDVTALASDAKPALAEIPNLNAADFAALGTSALAFVQAVLEALAK